MWRYGKLHTLLVVMWNGATTLDNTAVLKKFNPELSFDTAITLLCIYPRKLTIYVRTETCTRMLALLSAERWWSEMDQADSWLSVLSRLFLIPLRGQSFPLCLLCYWGGEKSLIVSPEECYQALIHNSSSTIAGPLGMEPEMWLPNCEDSEYGHRHMHASFGPASQRDRRVVISPFLPRGVSPRASTLASKYSNTRMADARWLSPYLGFPLRGIWEIKFYPWYSSPETLVSSDILWPHKNVNTLFLIHM